MTDTPTASDSTYDMVRSWVASPTNIHKKPPYRAHSFDGDGRFWVVGSTGVSVLHCAHRPDWWAECVTACLNEAAERAQLGAAA